MISPKDVKDYTEFESVKERSESQLTYDIVQATQDIVRYCGHDFSEYDKLPDAAKLAFIKLTEFYALINADESMAKGIQSESLGSYSYSIGETKYTLSLKSLLDEYVEETSKRGTTFKMRVL